jgi:hypothetical protein
MIRRLKIDAGLVLLGTQTPELTNAHSCCLREPADRRADLPPVSQSNSQCEERCDHSGEGEEDLYQ